MLKRLEDRLALISLISVAIIIIFSAYNHSLNLEYKPYNGDFQTFNPIRRMFAGEIPGRDFNPYLGLGLTYLTAAGVYLFGGDFAACKFSTYLLAVFLHLIALTSLFFWTGFSLKKSIVAASYVVILLSFDFYKIATIWEIVAPSNSNLSIRSALPFLTGITLFLIFRFCPLNSYRFYLAIGCTIGVQPLWSNDYGIPSTIAAIAIVFLNLIKQDKKGLTSKVLVAMASAFISFSIIATLLTAGNLTNWLKSNFSGVAADQFWYFVWYHNKNKIFTLTQLIPHPILYFYLAATIYLIYHLLVKNYAIKHLILLYISLTVFGASTLSAVGGTISFRYYLPAVLVSLFIVPLSIYLWSGNYLKRIFHYYPKFSRTLKLFVPLILIVFLSIAPVANAIAYYSLFPTPNQKSGFFWVSELGGWLPEKWQTSIDIAKEIKQESPIPQVLSTYSSGIDTVARVFNPTGIDYIIHALGDDTRNLYLQNFKDSKPKYITTLREDFNNWETWARRTNWWFYREFLLKYKPVNGTFYNLIWERLDETIKQDRTIASCQIIPQSDRQVNLVINTEKVANDSRPYYIEIALKHNLQIKPSGIPFLGSRGLINALEENTALNRNIGHNTRRINRSYGIPPRHDNWRIPIEQELGKTAILQLQAYPANRAKLTVESCEAEVFVPLDNLSFNRQLTPANFTDSNWNRGIFIGANNSDRAAGFAIADTQILAELYPGMDIEFAGSGKRKIIEIDGDRVWVSGSLNPITDGYPHQIAATLR